MPDTRAAAIRRDAFLMAATPPPLADFFRYADA